MRVAVEVGRLRRRRTGILQDQVHETARGFAMLLCAR
jgi:hypothetical protein